MLGKGGMEINKTDVLQEFVFVVLAAKYPKEQRPDWTILDIKIISSAIIKCQHRKQCV